MMVTVAVIANKRGYERSRPRRATLGEIGKQFMTSFWGVFFPIGIILGIRFSLFTPSEGGAVAVLYCFIIASSSRST